MLQRQKASMIMMVLGRLARIAMVDIFLNSAATHLWEVEVFVNGLKHSLDSRMHESIMEPLKHIIDNCNWHNILSRRVRILLALNQQRVTIFNGTEQDGITLLGSLL
jgi:hypothetical protein